MAPLLDRLGLGPGARCLDAGCGPGVRSSDVSPPLDSIDEWRRVVRAAFEARGADPEVGAHLPQLFAQAGIGAPDGTDVASRLESFADGARFFIAVHQGAASAAIAHGITTGPEAAALRERIARDAERHPDRPILWPRLIGAWRRKPV
jgi:hypothetical protein